MRMQDKLFPFSNKTEVKRPPSMQVLRSAREISFAFSTQTISSRPENLPVSWRYSKTTLGSVGVWDIERKFDHETGARFPNNAVTNNGRWDARSLMASGTPPGISTACSGMSYLRKTLARILPMPEDFRITSDSYVKLAALALSEGWLEQTELTLQRIHGDNGYTKQPIKRRRAAGRTGLLIGIYFQERFPGLRRTAVHMLTRGLGMAWATGGVDPDCETYPPRISGGSISPTKDGSAIQGSVLDCEKPRRDLVSCSTGIEAASDS